MTKYQQFIFKSYSFDKTSGVLTLNYAIDQSLFFTETYKFEFEFIEYDESLLDKAFQTLFFLAGVSYYKLFIPPKITVEQGTIDRLTAEFLSATYQKGLGELFYVNSLDPNASIEFPVNSDKSTPHLPLESTQQFNGLLVGIGGGKDSLVTAEILRNSNNSITTWSLNHRSQLTPLIEKIGLNHAWVSREWDKQILDLNKQGAYNGHVPISAIFAAVGTIVCILTGKRDHVVSNEQSANEPSLEYKGLRINHQYSKSQEFEQLYQRLTHHYYGDSLRYYSFLRPLSELKIGELFSKIGFEKYKDVFSSCNRAYTHDSHKMWWCGKCPKCAFVFLALTPFVEKPKLETLFDGKNLLTDPLMKSSYKKLLNIGADKPLDCVGEIKESRSAMQMAQKTYSNLSEDYQFELPKDYNYARLGSHSMPKEVFSILNQAL